MKGLPDPDETTAKSSPRTDVRSPDVQQLADELMAEDPQMSRREAEQKALWQQLEE